MKPKSIFVLGNLQSSNEMWLEYHCFKNRLIYLSIVSDKEDIKMLQSLNLLIGSTESYDCYAKLINIAMKGRMIISFNNVKSINELRLSICSTICIISNYENTIIKD